MLCKACFNLTEKAAFNLPDNRHIKLHGTRHSAISLLLSEGVPIQIAQQRAGHQDPKITLGVYSHVSKDKESLVADTLEDVLFSAVGE